MGIHDFQAKGGGGRRNPAAGVWHMQRTHSGELVQVKKDGAGGKGTWCKLLDSGPDSRIDSNGPSYDSGEGPYQLEDATVFNPAHESHDYKKSIATIIEEYFSDCDVELATTELRDLDSDEYHHLFVKKLVSMAMDRHDKQKEMASGFCYPLVDETFWMSQMS
ncbi:MA3 DOMAIN-CONTAINING TRANSLATION REGULATORY FACTOR 1-like [Zingiber officinale]|uniref:MA3 DOMAIN-CONTAINING TRANSLATION REGULATORY FACTOR 1-like n=1 Tax=Zingiber officinale TaxID=94328 RepID=UPI001C4A7769|nr:MA3 DOMAIN-CONTAINING TRANSLATION REGULATORY FACTOR 1-like [Zingiber officinale]